MNNSLINIINNNNFITGFRATDTCRIKNKVVNIRSINNPKYDILPENFNNVSYNEDIINNKILPYIYGDINSYINFPNIIKNIKYTICCISRYNNIYNNKILTIENPNNKISAIGHSDTWSGIIEFNNSSSITSYKTTKNYNNNWVITCLSYDGDINTGYADIYIGTDIDTNNENYSYFNVKNVSPAIIGNLSINNTSIPSFNSDWALSHLLVWNVPLSSFDLRTVYNNMAKYIHNPAENDLKFYNEYPRNLLNCVEQFYNINTEMNSANNYINVKNPTFAYYAGNYNNGILPNFINNTNRIYDISPTNMKNVKLNNSDKIPFLYGNKDSYIIFPENSINSNFTICSITKYISKNPDNNKKILRSINDSVQFYHGHHNNKIGVIEYDNYEFSKGITITADNPIDSWIITCAKNSQSPNNVLVNDNNLSPVSIDNNYFTTNKNPSTLSINYANNLNFTDNSEWALIYLLIWDSHLNDDELKIVSASLNKYLKDGIELKFNILPEVPKHVIGTQTTSISNKNYIDKYPHLNLTDLQKKMLL